jgi:hypothetical protein
LFAFKKKSSRLSNRSCWDVIQTVEFWMEIIFALIKSHLVVINAFCFIVLYTFILRFNSNFLKIRFQSINWSIVGRNSLKRNCFVL